jgi:hypothetical protein
MGIACMGHGTWGGRRDIRSVRGWLIVAFIGRPAISGPLGIAVLVCSWPIQMLIPHYCQVSPETNMLQLACRTLNAWQGKGKALSVSTITPEETTLGPDRYNCRHIFTFMFRTAVFIQCKNQLTRQHVRLGLKQNTNCPVISLPRIACRSIYGGELQCLGGRAKSVASRSLLKNTIVLHNN